MFIFTDVFPEKGQGDLHVNVDSSFRNNADLINYIEEKTSSPYHDGDNWDGFYDSITEMEWFESINNFCILHDSLPQIEQIHIYLDILNVTDVWWEIYPENVKIKNELLKNPSEMQKRIEFFVKYFGMEASQVPREERVIIKNFNVYFKKRDEAFVRDCLAKYSKDYRKHLYYDKSGLIRIK